MQKVYETIKHNEDKVDIEFTYSERCRIFDHILKTRTRDGLSIEVCFESDVATYFYLSGEEFPIEDNFYHGLYVAFGSGLEHRVVPLRYVIASAIEQLPQIVEEVEQEQADEERYQRHVRSGYYGRV